MFEKQANFAATIFNQFYGPSMLHVLCGFSIDLQDFITNLLWQVGGEKTGLKQIFGKGKR